MSLAEAGHHRAVEAELKDAIEGLYRVFERYPLRPSTEPCLHCHEPGDEKVLHEHLLRALSAEDLSGFAGEALMVWGTEVDFKHFLPRIMEITVAQDGLDWPDIESIFGRLANAKWREWPADEREAVEAVLRAFWRSGLGRYPATHDIGSMLTAVASTDGELAPFLDEWLEQGGEAPLRHLAEFSEMHATLVVTRGRPSNAFWGVEQRRATETLRSWLRSGRPRQRLIDGFFSASDGGVEEDLSNAVRVLEALEALPRAT